MPRESRSGDGTAAVFAFRTEYDALRRPVRQYVDGGDQYERNAGAHPCNLLYERTIYGDSVDTGMTEHRQRVANLRGRVFRHFDTSGVTTTERYDFKGNPVGPPASSPASIGTHRTGRDAGVRVGTVH